MHPLRITFAHIPQSIRRRAERLCAAQRARAGAKMMQDGLRNGTLGAICLLLSALGANPGQADNASPAIAEAYAQRDAAYARSDPGGLVASLGPTLHVVASGQARDLSRGEQLEAARFELRQLPGRRLTRNEQTQIRSMSGVGGTRVVTARINQVVDTVSNDGTTVHASFVIDVRDTWEHLAEGWRQTGREQTGISRSASGKPSPAAVASLQRLQQTRAAGEAAVANLRRQNDILRDFNAANNYSECMNATRMQRFDYDERRQRCR